jgi:hypothetical protein
VSVLRDPYLLPADATPSFPDSVLRGAELYVQRLELLARHRKLTALAMETPSVGVETRMLLEQERAERLETGKAREELRAAVRASVVELRGQGVSVCGLVQRAGNMMRVLRDSLVTPDDGGNLEAEVMRWAIEEYYNAA